CNYCFCLHIIYPTLNEKYEKPPINKIPMIISKTSRYLLFILFLISASFTPIMEWTVNKTKNAILSHTE
ncbi:MAG: hypothetical protein M1308_06605, partial [Actinobacteria bacterium]|nr:hypothetical protein [Actinomycetota bacterium]